MSKLLPLDLFIRQALLYPLTSPFLPPENKVLKDYSYAAGKKTGSYVAPPTARLLKTGQTVKYADGDDGDLEKGIAKSYTYSQENGIDTEEENILVDDNTKLVWIRDHTLVTGSEEGAGGNQNLSVIALWATALTKCNAFIYGGKSDWRLPNIFEIQSLAKMNAAIGAPHIDTTAFPNCYASPYYWASTTYPVNTDYGGYWSGTGGGTGFATKDHEYWIRPVRGPD